MHHVLPVFLQLDKRLLLLLLPRFSLMHRDIPTHNLNHHSMWEGLHLVRDDEQRYRDDRASVGDA